MRVLLPFGRRFVPPRGGYRHSSSIEFPPTGAVFAVFGMSHERKLSLPAENLSAEAADSRNRSAELEAKLAKQAAEAAKLDAELTRVRTDAARLVRELETSRRELQWMLTSSSWRLTRPLRVLATASPKLTKYGRRLANT